MDAIDGTNNKSTGSNGPPPSLLTIILDTNPYAWALNSATLPLSKVVANLLVFINAHLAINHANQVVVIASHITGAQWLYPTPKPPQPGGKLAANGADTVMSEGIESDCKTTTPGDANKYHPFQEVEQQLLRNLSSLVDSTTAQDLTDRTNTMVAGALTMALTYISKQTLLLSPNDASSILNSDTAVRAESGINDDSTSARSQSSLTSRILLVSVSGDLEDQHIPIMNAIFAAQRQRVPIDVLKLAGDTVFLQQACDSTGGIYLDPSTYVPQRTSNGSKATSDKESAASGSLQGILIHLLHPLLPDPYARRALVPPADASVDFRAACFCHRRVLDIGYACSVCLSIFCEPLAEGVCLTCGMQLVLPREATVVPALLPRPKKKKKKRQLGGLLVGGDSPSSAAGTPAPTD